MEIDLSKLSSHGKRYLEQMTIAAYWYAVGRQDALWDMAKSAGEDNSHKFSHKFSIHYRELVYLYMTESKFRPSINAEWTVFQEGK